MSKRDRDARDGNLADPKVVEICVFAKELEVTRMALVKIDLYKIEM